MASGLLPYISGSVCTVKLHSILHLLFSITTSDFCLYQFFSLLSRIFDIFPNESSFQTSHVIFYTPFGLTYCIPVSPRFTLSSAFQHILHLLFFWVTLFFAFVMLCVIWYHLYNFKNVKNAHGRVLLLVKFQAEASSMGVFTFFKLYKWYQLTQRIYAVGSYSLFLCSHY